MLLRKQGSAYPDRTDRERLMGLVLNRLWQRFRTIHRLLNILRWEIRPTYIPKALPRSHGHKCLFFVVMTYDRCRELRLYDLNDNADWRAEPYRISCRALP